MYSTWFKKHSKEDNSLPIFTISSHIRNHFKTMSTRKLLLATKYDFFLPNHQKSSMHYLQNEFAFLFKLIVQKRCLVENWIKMHANVACLKDEPTDIKWINAFPQLISCRDQEPSERSGAKCVCEFKLMNTTISEKVTRELISLALNCKKRR